MAWARSPPRTMYRDAFTTTEMGLTFAKPWSHDGIVSTGTNALDANTSGNTHTKLAAWADSTSRTRRPMFDEIHENARPNNTANRIAPTVASGPPWNRNPIR